MALGDIIKITPPTGWTLSSGLSALGDLLSLYRFEDLFQDYEIDTSKMGAAVSGGGTVKQIPSLYAWTKSTTDAAILYAKEALDIGVVECYVYRFNTGFVNSANQPFMIKQGVTAPDIDGDVPVIKVEVRGNEFWRLGYRDNAGTEYSWNDITNDWVPVGRDLSTSIDFNNAFEVRLDKTATGWSFIFKDLTTDTVIVDTSAAPIAWAATYDAGVGVNYFLCGGDYATSGSLAETRAVSIWKNYPLTPQVATMGQIAFNGIFKQFPILQSIEAGASGVWEYNKDNEGWVQPAAGAPVDVFNALEGLYLTTLDLRVTLTSDANGDAAASIDINGGVVGTESDNPTITGGDLYKAVYNRAITFPALSAIIDTRVYPIHLPQDVTYPAVTYQVLSSDPRFSAFGATSDADAAVVYKRLRLHCWDTEYNSLIDLKNAVRLAFQRYTGVNNGVVIRECFVDNEIELYEDELKVNHYIIDFRIAYEEGK